jgi:hypothetical protein
MEKNICDVFVLVVFVFRFQFHMVEILFSNYYRCNIGAYMDFEYHFLGFYF